MTVSRSYSYNVPAIGSFQPVPQVLPISGVSANIQLQPGLYYRIWASVDAFFDVGPTNAVAATVSSHPITGKLDYLHSTDNTNVWLAAIAASGSGTLYISQINV